jgi:RNA polymerase sigma-70 factor, ECF subfamily
MDDHALVQALRRGDEAAFATVVDRYGPLMSRVASRYLGSAALAEEVVQETWLAVVEGIDRFEERSSLKTWLLGILVNRARTRRARESRSVPLSSLPEADPPTARSSPEATFLAREALGMAEAAIRALPERQQHVIALRDLAGWSPRDVAAALGLTDNNERVLLHRARTTVRAALAAY